MFFLSFRFGEYSLISGERSGFSNCGTDLYRLTVSILLLKLNSMPLFFFLCFEFRHSRLRSTRTSDGVRTWCEFSFGLERVTLHSGELRLLSSSGYLRLNFDLDAFLVRNSWLIRTGIFLALAC